ncbi:hypothetical protein HS99_0033395 [Kitasatospora aureofaciens]|uniref:Uncharacterized protein n=1 Tax=Kitasatospora aureofaciens TaxID=1894 RepID=A0A1E7N3F2_KITAU|nr:hypothetical protein HS99_0033395 [Kitasatospora aureofaciens]
MRADSTVAAAEAAATTPVTANTEGQAPIRFASGCEPPKAATYRPVSAAAAAVPELRRHCRPGRAEQPADQAEGRPEALVVAGRDHRLQFGHRLQEGGLLTA